MGDSRQQRELQITEMLEGETLRRGYAEFGYDLRRLSVDELQVMRQILRKAAVDGSGEPELDERGLAQTSAVVVGCGHCREAAVAVCRSCGSREHVELRCPRCSCAVTARWVPSKAEERGS
jgi:hypothetical protein